MENRFKMWLRLCLAEEEMTLGELRSIKPGLKGYTNQLFKEFMDFDQRAVADFVFDCVQDLLKEGK